MTEIFYKYIEVDYKINFMPLKTVSITKPRKTKLGTFFLISETSIFLHFYSWFRLYELL